MTLRIIALLTLLLFAPSQRPALDARFIGNMAFAITDGTVTLMTDFPYESGYSRYMTYPSSEIRSGTAKTLSLITHKHGDHWEPALFAKTDWTVAGPSDVTAGIQADRVLPFSASTATFGPISVQALETPHARIGHYSYIVTWHARRLYFSGDTEATDSLAAAKNLDVAFVSPWMFRSMRRRGTPIDAKRVVIYHQESGERVAECTGTCTLLRQGDSMHID